MATGLCIALLAGCEPGRLPGPPPSAPSPPETPQEPAQSAQSRELAGYYARAEAELLAQGLLRTDGGGPDVRYSQRDLAENFIKIGFFTEYRRTSSGRYIRSETESALHRWSQPVRVALYFGAQVTEDRRRAVSTELRRYTRQLSRATGHPVVTASSQANFHILVVDEDERQALAPTLTSIDPRLSDSDIRAITELPRQIFCRLVTISGRNAPNIYDVAFAVIRAEHPPHLTTQCLHEELAQGLGLPNDSRYARPSIFNDNEEFGRLTPHDEMLLKMLYDPRLHPGMSADQARPIIEIMASELLPDKV